LYVIYRDDGCNVGSVVPTAVKAAKMYPFKMFWYLRLFEILVSINFSKRLMSCNPIGMYSMYVFHLFVFF